MTGAEIVTYAVRLARFADKGVTVDIAESVADKLVIRDRDKDDRRTCLECFNLAGRGAGPWQCRNWQRAGIARRASDAQLPGEVVCALQRCDGFKGV
jgi:hypothetical protein